MHELKHALGIFSIILLEAIVVSNSLILSFALRFEFSLPAGSLTVLPAALLLCLVAKLAASYACRLHRRSWAFVSVSEAVLLLVSNLLGSGLFFAAGFTLLGSKFPTSVYCIDFLICSLSSSGVLLLLRLQRDGNKRTSKNNKARILIYGAGSAGITMVREINSNPALGYTVLGFLDDDRSKHNSELDGVPVLGTGRDAAAIVNVIGKKHRVDEIIIAVPSASGRQMREILANCRAAGVPSKTIPGIGELLTGKVLTSQVRGISVTDLLSREPVQLQEDRIREFLTGRSVMVTGGAGSIGSEICRQVAAYGPRCLVIFDQAESELFKIDMELRGRFRLPINAVVGDIRQPARLDEVMRKHAIEVVFHAAAYKHVPLMESNVTEAVQTNVIGTWNVVQTALRNHASKVLMLSSDKAVNPSSVMGLTKRVAELIVSSVQGNLTCVAVRFGNVLASNGSVIPIFQAQIAAGGPVTITHPDMKRYFMTIREAVQLVLQAFIIGRGSEIFVLDMGEPVRIVDLARNMIRLSGLTPDEDIEIRVIGSRPGEKLFEELNGKNDGMVPTHHKDIKIFRSMRLSYDALRPWLTELEHLLASRDETQMMKHMSLLVPEYDPAQSCASDTVAGRRSDRFTPLFVVPVSQPKVASAAAGNTSN